MSNSVFFGASIAVLSSLLNSVSLTLQKKTHMNLALTNKHRSSSVSLSYLKQPLWLIGLALMVFAESLNFVAFNLAPVYVISPLGGLTVVGNAVLARIWLGEEMSLFQMLGIGLCLGGSITVLVNASGAATAAAVAPQTAVTVIQNVFSIPSIIYLTYVVLAVAILVRRVSLAGNRPLVIWFVLLTATLGSLTVSSAKTAVLMWRDASKLPSGIFFYLLPYVVSLIPAFSVVFQVKFLNVALTNFISSTVIPLQYVFFTFLTTIGSAVLFNELSGLSFTRAFGLVMGFCYSGGGVYLLTSKTKSTSLSDRDRQKGKDKGKGNNKNKDSNKNKNKVNMNMGTISMSSNRELGENDGSNSTDGHGHPHERQSQSQNSIMPEKRTAKAKVTQMQMQSDHDDDEFKVQVHVQ